MATKKAAKKAKPAKTSKTKAAAPKKKLAAKKAAPKKLSRKIAPKKFSPSPRPSPRSAGRGSNAPPPPPADALLEREVHPKLTWLLANLKPGRHAGGLLQFALPGAHAAELEPWLMGKTEGRTSIGRTAFGELLVFRDLRDHAASLGMEDAEFACDVAAIDIHFKRMKILATSAEEFVQLLDDEEWQRAFLRLPIFAAARARLGDWDQHECYGFVPALSLGGAEHAASVQRVDWRVHQSILLQT